MLPGAQQSGPSPLHRRWFLRLAESHQAETICGGGDGRWPEGDDRWAEQALPAGGRALQGPAVWHVRDLLRLAGGRLCEAGLVQRHRGL